MTTIVPSPEDLIARFVEPDMHVHLAMTTAPPNAATLALARRFAGQRSLTVSMVAVYSASHALALSGAVDRMITCSSATRGRNHDRTRSTATCCTAGRFTSTCGRCSPWCSD